MIDIQVRPPDGERRAWHYVTCGLAKVRADGAELVLATPSRCDWAARLLVELAAYLHEEDAVMIVPGDRMPTGAFAKVAPGTELTHIIATTSHDYPSTFIHLVGATADEIEHAKKEGGAFGTKVLGETLRRMGVGLVTDPSRRSLTTDEAFARTWREVAQSV